MTSSLVRESRLPVGSSASSICGLLTMALAMATRSCSLLQAVHPDDSQRQHDVLDSGEIRDQMKSLEDEPQLLRPEVGQMFSGELIELHSCHLDLPLCRMIHPPEDRKK